MCTNRQPFKQIEFEMLSPKTVLHRISESIGAVGTTNVCVMFTYISLPGALSWSHGIDLSSPYDVFVTVPGVSDIKVHMEKVGHTVHVFVDPMNRAQISAKEIRSRIRGGGGDVEDRVKGNKVSFSKKDACNVKSFNPFLAVWNHPVWSKHNSVPVTSPSNFY